MGIFLNTERLILRHFTEADAEHLVAMDGNPEVMRYIGSPLPDVEAYRARIRTLFLPYYDRFEHYGFWPAVAKATGEFLGWFHLRPALDYRFAVEAGYEPGDVDLGYRFRKETWGRGYATEGARALVENAFTHTDAARVVAAVLVDNAASVRVLEKAGLRRVNDFAFPGYEMAAAKYALSREDFKASAG